MADISLNQGGRCLTFHGKVVSGFTYTEGMAVTLTGANEVGPGVSGGSPVFGIVTKVEVDAKDASGAPSDIVLGVMVEGASDHVKMTATGASQPAAGTPAYCNDKGEIVKAPEAAAAWTRGLVLAVGTPATGYATILL